MNLNDYQEKAVSTAIYNREKYKLIYPTLGLTGEAGEVAEKIKKLLRDHNGVLTREYEEQILKECGDVLWYLANLTQDLGYSLEYVAKINLAKLQSRKEREVLTGNGDNR